MMLHRLLFQTRAGAWLLTQLEARANLAIVKADWLGAQKSGPVRRVSASPALTTAHQEA